MFSQNDLDQIAAKGIDLNKIEEQIQHFKAGFPFVNLAKAATIGDGIKKLSESELNQYAEEYESSQASRLKFVPASGAATRMFKALFEQLEAFNKDENAAIAKDVQLFLDHIEEFAFSKYLFENAPSRSPKDILTTLLYSMNYGGLPKGLLLFHKYANHARTPVAEQLADAWLYASKGSEINVHFTVSPEHMALFQQNVADVAAHYPKGIFNVSYSIQKPETDTIAVDPENTPFRSDTNAMVFRPAGHGALLSNLNDLSADIIFIKNIDNVVPQQLKAEMVTYKKALAGVLLNVQKDLFHFQKSFKYGNLDFEKATDFLKTHFGYIKSKESTWDQALFKPLRVCGMVKNIGEPGGGPFWVNTMEGVALQIIESAQINMNDETQRAIFESSSHFNPVDLVCGVLDFEDRKYDLNLFSDPSTGFITEKSQNGKKLKAMELPGLWNGSMARWHTIFVEIPLATFNPVKTVNDLLREQHRAV